MDDAVLVTCPCCGEEVEVYVDPGSEGALVQDCEVCCRPWQLTVRRDEDGALQVSIDRA